jgi:hypothetical protein
MEPETESKFLISWSRSQSRTKIDRILNTGRVRTAKFALKLANIAQQLVMSAQNWAKSAQKWRNPNKFGQRRTNDVRIRNTPTRFVSGWVDAFS